MTLSAPVNPPAGAVSARVVLLGAPPVITRDSGVQRRDEILSERIVALSDFPIQVESRPGADSLRCEFLDADNRLLGLFHERVTGGNVTLTSVPASPFFTGLELEFPTTDLTVGQQVQPTVTLTRAGGFEEEGVDLINFNSSGPTRVEVSDQPGTKGQTTGLAPGQALVTATLNTLGPDLVIGTGTKVVTLRDGRVLLSFYPFSREFRSSISLALGEFNGDGVPDIITGAGPGDPPAVRVFDGRNGDILASFFVYNSNFLGGVNVAAGDIDGDGTDELVVAPGEGGTEVRVFDNFQSTFGFEPFQPDPTFLGGVRVAAGDTDGDGVDDIIVAPGAGREALVRVFDGSNPPNELNSFLAFPDFLGGVFVSSGDVLANGRDAVIVRAVGSSPLFRNGRTVVLDGQTGGPIITFEGGDGDDAGLFGFRVPTRPGAGGAELAVANVFAIGDPRSLSAAFANFPINPEDGRIVGYSLFSIVQPAMQSLEAQPQGLVVPEGLGFNIGEFGADVDVPANFPALTAAQTIIVGPGGGPGPQIGSLVPARGLAAGGDTVEVIGEGFLDGSTTLTINGRPLQNLVVVNPNLLRGEVPPLQAGEPVVADVVLQIAGFPDVTDPGGFGYVIPLQSPDPQVDGHFGAGLQALPFGSSIPGVSLAIGDFDNQNGLDLAVGEPDASVGGALAAGRVQVFFNDGTGRFDPARSRTLDCGPVAGARFGFSVAAGDWTGNGQTDLLVGAPGADKVIGFGNGFTRTETAMATVGGPGSLFGFAVSAGNLDADPALEFMVGSPFAALFGPNSGLVEFYDNDFSRLEGFSGGGDNLRGAALVFGDFTLNSFDDPFESSPGIGNGAGRVERRISTGGTPRFSGAAIVFPEVVAGETGGVFIDVGRARPDVAQGRPDATVGGLASGGIVDLLFSDGAGGESSRITVMPPGSEAGARFGLAGVFGNLDGSGSDDLVISAPFASGLGSVYTYLSNNGAVTLQSRLVEPVGETGAQFGLSTATGDLNNDGIDDIVISAPFGTANGQAGAGEAFIFYTPRP